MQHSIPCIQRRKPISRREMLWHTGGGLGGIALASMLDNEGLIAGTNSLGGGVLTGKLHHPAKAKRVVQLFMAGAASHIDLWDHKPALEKHHGEPADFGEKIETFFNEGQGPWLKSPWKFRPYGKCGKLLSDAVTPIGDVVDEIAFVHNMVGKTAVHSQATYLQATGFQRPGFPGMGCWVSYALGNMNQNLPTFVVLPDHRGFASGGTKNWHAAFLPAQHQGTIIRPGTSNSIADLYPPAGSFVSDANNASAHGLLARLNRQHIASRPGDSRLEARIKSYELAAGMQLAAPEALDLSRESKQTLKLYGLDHGKTIWPDKINPLEEQDYFGRKCLVARRLLERGVRFVQIWSGQQNDFPRRNWDSHEDIVRDHGPLAWGMSVGVRALITDLKQRGMLDDTIVLWTTEFGRMPSSQEKTGRDHNAFVFTNWLAGGGIKGGTSYGPSDQWGFKPLDRNHSTQVYDIHATVLHLLGIDHKRLTIRHDGIDRRLTDVHGRVIHDITS